MRNKKADNTKVGMLVLAGLAFLILTLYMIGKNRNLFGPTFTITAVLNNVNGLVPGNNVRFKGMDVGTVRSINVENDTAVLVALTIDESMKSFIKQNAIATIGTDGLMGNKLININSGISPSQPIRQGDFIRSRKPVETDDMLRTLNTTNNNIERITENLYEISVKLNSSESLWTLLSDTIMTKDLKIAILNFREAGANTVDVTATAKQLFQNLDTENGLAHTLFSDTTLSAQLASSLHQIEQVSNQSSIIVRDLKTIVEDMKHGDGTAGLILTDTLLRQSLFRSAINIEEGTDLFNQNMEALKTNFLFRRYFRKLEKEQKRETSAAKSN